jgi:hypothetical protein
MESESEGKKYYARSPAELSKFKLTTAVATTKSVLRASFIASSTPVKSKANKDDVIVVGKVYGLG